jgi:CheY-like chemotaxis protein
VHCGDATLAKPHRRSLRILAAEDNATNRRIIRTYLEAWGHSVTTANDGPDAARLFAEEKFDLVLMDLQMPRMDGIAAAASIRQSEPPGGHVPILALTANVLKGTREECHAAGMDGYLAKPVRECELLAAIEAVVPDLKAVPPAPQHIETPHTAEAPPCTDPFDARALAGGVNGSRSTLEGLLHDSRDGDLPELFAQIEAALAAGETAAVQRAAHAMKGVLGVFHAPAAYAAARRLEQSARAGETARLSAEAKELRLAVSELLLSLERFVAVSPLLSQAA